MCEHDSNSGPIVIYNMVKTFYTASKLSAEELATNISNIWVFMAHIINIAFYPYTLWILYQDLGET